MGRQEPDNIDEVNGSVVRLQKKLGYEWAAINEARERTGATLLKLKGTLKGLDSTDASIVAYGSLARGEWTCKSDVDWTLLIDGQADPQHLEVAQNIAIRLKRDAFTEPGPAGVFGSMTFSHDLVHKIGGQEDTNENTTQRILLLLESLSIGKPDAYERVISLIITRYLEDDRGLKYGNLPYKVPRFLLSDIVRYWRMVAVDFVEKQRGRRGEGWGLRNAKLRASRKLLFATGLLTCFSCDMFSTKEAREALSGTERSTAPMAKHLRRVVCAAPLDILAFFLLNLRIKPKTCKMLLGSYDSFLALLNNEEKREHLKNLTPDDIPGDVVFDEVRRITRRFQEGLTSLFFSDDDRVCELIEFYGVF